MSTDALAIAADLAAAGEVVVTAPPNPHFDPAARSGDPRAKEYRLPTGWQDLAADPAGLRRWRPGWALLLVTSKCLAAIDVDTKHGADRDAEVARLDALGVPILGEVRTPTGGAHLYIPAVGLASTNNPARGIDSRGRALDGTGTGFLYLPGTQRPKYAGRGYEWVRVPDPAEAADYATADTADALAAYLLAIGSTARTRGLGTEVPEGEDLPEHLPLTLRAMLADLGPTWCIRGKRSGDHSARFYRLVCECHRHGLTKGQTVSALDPWCTATARYTGRVAAEVGRAWTKIDAAARGGAA